jgi:glycosyltransferase involved in cell wall biosynthesis
MSRFAGEQTKRTLWILTEVYYPEEISTGYYLTSIAECLTTEWNVKVLTGQPRHMARGLRAPKRETRNRVEIHRLWGTVLDKNILVFRLVNMLTIGLSTFFASVRRFRRGDKVLVVTAPPSLPFTTTIAAMIRGTGLTLLVQDSYPEILVAVGAARADSRFVQAVHLLNRWVYKYAEKVIVMGRDMHELFTKKTAGLDLTVVTIPNWADLAAIRPTPRETNELLVKLGIADKFVLLYAGNIGHPTDVETIIECAAGLRDRPDIHFLFIGNGSKKAWLAAQIESFGLENVTLLDYQPRSTQNVFLNACDVGLVALVNGMKGTAMPSRTYNLMAAGKPVLAIAEAGSELAMVIEEDNIGYRTEPGDAAAFKRGVLTLLEDTELRTQMGQRAREAAVAKYSAETACERYREALR